MPVNVVPIDAVTQRVVVSHIHSKADQIVSWPQPRKEISTMLVYNAVYEPKKYIRMATSDNLV